MVYISGRHSKYFVPFVFSTLSILLLLNFFYRSEALVVSAQVSPPSVVTRASVSNSVSSNVLSLNLAVPASTSDLLLVQALGSDNDGATPGTDCVVTSVTFDGQSLTRMESRQQASGVPAAYSCVEMWYLINPPNATSTKTVTVTWSGSVARRIVGAVVITGAAQAPPAAAAENSCIGCTAISSSLITNSNNHLIVDAIGTGDADLIIPNAPQTSEFNVPATSMRGGSSTYVAVSSGLHTMTWSNNTPSGSWNRIVSVAVAIAPHVASPGTLVGYAWSSNIGWISFSNTNPGDGATNPYGVQIASGGLMSGHAWANPKDEFSGSGGVNNIGWLSFNASDLSGCPDTPCEARLDQDTGHVTGWARFCSGIDPIDITSANDCSGGNRADGWDGWVSLDTKPGETVEYGITVIDCDWIGWAWGGAVVGWISFSKGAFGHPPVGANWEGVTGTSGACVSTARPTLKIYPADQLGVDINSDPITYTAEYDADGSGTDFSPETVPITNWSSADTSVADIDPSTGIATINGEGSTIISASYTGSGGYAADSTNLAVAAGVPSFSLDFEINTRNSLAVVLGDAGGFATSSTIVVKAIGFSGYKENILLSVESICLVDLISPCEPAEKLTEGVDYHIEGVFENSILTCPGCSGAVTTFTPTDFNIRIENHVERGNYILIIKGEQDPATGCSSCASDTKDVPFLIKDKAFNRLET